MYLCTLKRWEYSSVGLEHLPYKQRVIGSNPITPTKEKAITNQWLLFSFDLLNVIQLSIFVCLRLCQLLFLCSKLRLQGC